MFKQTLTALLACSLIWMLAFTEPAVAKSKMEKDAQRSEKVKTGIARLGVGEEARVVVTLRDGRKVAGYVKATGEDSFVIADSKTGEATTVPYPDVAQVQGHNLSRTAKIAIIALAIGVGVLAFFLVLENTG
ncbi:MAG: hypothetical protein ABI882_15400 [Acidobacteriota bacterium]